VIVVDVNVIAYLLIVGDKTVNAQALRELDTDWIVPDLWRDEFLNILATYIRQGGTDLETAKKMWQTATDLFRAAERRADPISALELAHQHRLSAYDAQYLAVAFKLNLKLITEDKALRQAVPQHCLTMSEFLEQQSGQSAGE
jgi:predicted nucleic acid-binding protein